MEMIFTLLPEEGISFGLILFILLFFFIPLVTSQILKTTIHFFTERFLMRLFPSKQHNKILIRDNTEEGSRLERKEILRWFLNFSLVYLFIVCFAPFLVANLFPLIGILIFSFLYPVMGFIILADQINIMIYGFHRIQQPNQFLKQMAHLALLVFGVSMLALSVFFADIYKAKKNAFIDELVGSLSIDFIYFMPT